MDNELIGLLQQLIKSNDDLNLILLKIAENTKSTWDFNWNSVASIATGLSAIATLVLAWLTWQMVKEMKEARISEYRPYIIAYLEFKEHNVHFICKNIGKSVGKNVKVSFNKDFWGIEKYDIRNEVFNIPISSMPPEYEIKTFVNTSIDILKNYPNKEKHYFIDVTIEYDDGYTHEYSDTYRIDLGERTGILFMRGTETKNEQHLNDIATELHLMRECIAPSEVLEGEDALRELIKHHDPN